VLIHASFTAWVVQPFGRKKPQEHCGCLALGLRQPRFEADFKLASILALNIGFKRARFGWPVSESFELLSSSDEWANTGGLSSASSGLL